ncbi:MAG: sigma-70 family RNA polymerase sigma factor [Planctomycetota bacterium]
MDFSGRKGPAGAVILAGGLSKRMGYPKALMRHEGLTWLESIVSSYKQAHVQNILAVTHHQVATHPDFPLLTGLDLLVLDEPTPSPLHTLWQALDRMPEGWTGFWVHPVDHPFVQIETISAMLHAFQTTDALIIQPCMDDRGGHPVLIDRILDGEICNASPEQGLREVVRKDRARVLRLPVEDGGILRGFNRPEDLDEPQERIGEWVRKALNKDQEAISRLFDLYENRMVKAAHFRLGRTLHSLMESVDLVQSVWKDALDHLDQFEYRGPDSFYKWLHSCLINKIHSKRRYHGAGKRDVQKKDRLLHEEQLSSEVSQISDDPTPSVAAMSSEEMGRLNRILDRFPEIQREVILCRMRDDMDFSEISRQINKSVEATKKIYQRGIKKLLDQLPAEWRENQP